MVDMTDWDDKTYWAFYDTFSVGPESDNYRLHVDGFNLKSTAGDSLTTSRSKYVHNGMNFTTIDRDNDNRQDDNCAVLRGGSWWYNSCFYANPTGRYVSGGSDDYTGMIWWTASKV